MQPKDHLFNALAEISDALARLNGMSLLVSDDTAIKLRQTVANLTEAEGCINFALQDLA